jgi:hypothetical protein
MPMDAVVMPFRAGQEDNEKKRGEYDHRYPSAPTKAQGNRRQKKPEYAEESLGDLVVQ